MQATMEQPATTSYPTGSTLVGYARCSSDKRDLAAQRAALEDTGVTPDRVYTDHGRSGTNWARPGLDQALAARRAGDTLVVRKLDQLLKRHERLSRQ
jgi:DNA invertase Pin-like site-specific DNA recombinase